MVGELLSCGNGTTADPSRTWSNSTVRSCAGKHLTDGVGPCIQEKTNMLTVKHVFKRFSEHGGLRPGPSRLFNSLIPIGCTKCLQKA